MIERSASQIATFRLCPRRWWYSRMIKSDRKNPYAVFGIEMHDVLEYWFKERRPLDLDTKVGRAALQGLPFLPERPWLVEHWFTFEFGGVKYCGKIDLVWGSAKTVIVTDHKSIGNLDRRKTPEELAEDPQQIIYSYWAHKTFGLPVIAHWQYYRRVNPKSIPVIGPGAPDRMQELHDSCAGMTYLPIPERDVTACDVYPPEGCPYRQICKPNRSSYLLDQIANA